MKKHSNNKLNKYKEVKENQQANIVLFIKVEKSLAIKLATFNSNHLNKKNTLQIHLKKHINKLKKE
jgi:hypothetical protein